MYNKCMSESRATLYEVPYEPKLFPIPDEIVQETASVFAEFSEDELRVIRSANTDLLANDDPLRYMIRGGVRPRLKDAPEAAQIAYRTGACVAGVIIRKTINELEAAGHGVTQRRHTRYSEVGRQIREDLPWRFNIKKPPAYLKGVSPKFRRVHDFSAYFEHPQAVAFFDYLKQSWREHGAVVVDDELRSQAVEDLVILAARDTFEFFAKVYGEKVSPKRDSFIYSPHTPALGGVAMRNRA